MECKICKNESKYIFSNKILKKYEIGYFQCTNCNFIQTDTPYWLKEAYENPINQNDTGILTRNINFSRIVTSIIFFSNDKKGKFIDYAGGYGIFTRLMRDIGFDFYWYDPYTKNLLARGFEKKNADIKFNLLTTFETFEHLENPILEIEKMISLSRNIVFSTQLIPNNLDQNWWYFGVEHGQHISFYQDKTIQFIANKYNLYYYKLYDLHFLSENKISILKQMLIKYFSKQLLNIIIAKKLKSKTREDYNLNS